jgi:hypothetical protein
LVFSSKSKIERWFPLAVLALAGLGQWLMAQSHRSDSLIPAFLLYAGAVGLFLWIITPANKPGTEMPARMEWSLFGLILLLAVFLRFFQLDHIPPGIYIDASGPAVLALRMIHENWTPPFMLPKFAANPSFLLYLLAPWFRLFSPTQANLLLFYVLVSLAALPFIYWFFRQLAGAPVALLTLFFIAVMRWHIVFSRIGFRGILVPLFMFGTLAFLLYGLRKRKNWAIPVSALFLSGGLYTYQSFKAFPLLVLALLVFEAIQNPKGFRSQAKVLVVAALLAGVLTFPVTRDWVSQGSLGTRESQLFIGKAVWQEKSLKPLIDKLAQTALMFNRKGEEQPRHNLKDHRLLDDVTGVFFVLGFFLALKRWRERPFYYALCGFAVMSLPGILSVEATQSHRMLGALPFTAFFAAAALATFHQKFMAVYPKTAGAAGILFGALLTAALAQNARTYFVDQANDPDCWKSYSTDATLVGKAVAGHPDTFYYLAPAFYQHYSVQYLAFHDIHRVKEFNWNEFVSKPLDDSKPKVCFVLDAGKSPSVRLLTEVFPGGTLETIKDKKGEILAYFYTRPLPGPKVSLHRGLQREVHYFSTDPNTKPTKYLDPLVNFTHLGDFGAAQPSFSSAWQGQIQVPAAGSYGFLVLTTDQGELWLDGKQVVPVSGKMENTVTLKAGWHPLGLICRRFLNPDVSMDFHLLWKKPGQAQWEVVPNEAFGKAEP